MQHVDFTNIGAALRPVRGEVAATHLVAPDAVTWRAFEYASRAPAWVLLCLHCGLYPQPIESLKTLKNDCRRARNARSVGQWVNPRLKKAASVTPVLAMAANLDCLEHAILSGAQPTDQQDVDALECMVSGGSFRAWMRQAALSPAGPWPARQDVVSRTQYPGAHVLVVPARNSRQDLVEAVGRAFWAQCQAGRERTPPLDAVAWVLRCEMREAPAGELVKQVAATLRPDNARPGPRAREWVEWRKARKRAL